MNNIQYLIQLLQSYGLSSTEITNILTIIYNNILSYSNFNLENSFTTDGRYIQIFGLYNDEIYNITISEINEWNSNKYASI